MGNFMSLIAVLILVLLILYLSHVCTKVLGRGIGGRQANSHMQLIDRLPLGQDKAVAVIRMGKRYYLVGIAASSINLLAELPEEETKEVFTSTEQAGAGSYTENFKELLKSLADRHTKDR